MDQNGGDTRTFILGELSALLPDLRRLLRDPCAAREEQEVRRRVEAEFGKQAPVLIAISEGRLALLKPVWPPAVQERMREIREERRAAGSAAIRPGKKLQQVSASGKTSRGGMSGGIDVLADNTFEGSLITLFQTMGYRVTVCECKRGADLLLEKGGALTVVLIKRGGGDVPDAIVKEMLHARTGYGCHRGIVVTINRFAGVRIDQVGAYPS
jgi:hypothetical protein